MLEVGSGAVVHHVAPASAFFPSITMSDYVEDNVEELKRWFRGQSTLKQFLHVAAEVEGYDGKNTKAGQKLLENRIKRSVREVIRCDVLADEFFLEAVKTRAGPPYDLIISTFCLETVAVDMNSYVMALKTIRKLLRHGGGLILIGLLGAKRWKLAQRKYHYFEIYEGDVKSALRESGFGNIDMKLYGSFSIKHEHKNMFCAASEKVKI